MPEAGITRCAPSGPDTHRSLPDTVIESVTSSDGWPGTVTATVTALVARSVTVALAVTASVTSPDAGASTAIATVTDSVTTSAGVPTLSTESVTDSVSPFVDSRPAPDAVTASVTAGHDLRLRH